jgi:nucleolin
VKGLSFQAYQSDIEDLFNPFGNVISVRLLTRDDGKSKGLAFVKFSSKASFNKALELNQTEQFGRSITVEQSLGKQSNGGDRGGFQKGGNFRNNGNSGFGGNNGGNKFQSAGDANIETPTLFIGGLSYNSTRESIESYFRQAGEVASARIVTDRETGKVHFCLFSLVDLDTLNSMI